MSLGVAVNNSLQEACSDKKLFRLVFYIWSVILYLLLVLVILSVINELSTNTQDQQNMVAFLAWKNWIFVPLLIPAVVCVYGFFWTDGLFCFPFVLVSTLLTASFSGLYLFSGSLRGVIHGFPLFPLGYFDASIMAIALLASSGTALLILKNRHCPVESAAIIPMGNAKKRFVAITFFASTVFFAILTKAFIVNTELDKREINSELDFYLVGMFNQNEEFGWNFIRECLESGNDDFLMNALPFLSRNCFPRGEFSGPLSSCLIGSIARDYEALVLFLISIDIHHYAAGVDLDLMCVGGNRSMYYIKLLEKNGIDIRQSHHIDLLLRIAERMGQDDVVIYLSEGPSREREGEQ